MRLHAINNPQNPLGIEINKLAPVLKHRLFKPHAPRANRHAINANAKEEHRGLRHLDLHRPHHM